MANRNQENGQRRPSKVKVRERWMPFVQKPHVFPTLTSRKENSLNVKKNLLLHWILFWTSDHRRGRSRNQEPWDFFSKVRENVLWEKEGAEKTNHNLTWMSGSRHGNLWLCFHHRRKREKGKSKGRKEKRKEFQEEKRN